MKTSLRLLKVLVCALLVGVFLAACGGGGGDTSIPNIEYTGNTGVATITNSNAAELTTSAYKGADMGSSTVAVSAIGSGGSSGVSVPVALSKMVTTTVTDAVLNNGSVSALATSSTSGTCPGHPGYYTSDVSVDAAGNYSGTATYVNYCEVQGSAEVVLNGSVDVSGNMNFTTGRMTQRVLYNFITVKTTVGAVPTGSVTVAGVVDTVVNVDMDTFMATSMSSTTNLGMRDNITEQTFKIHNYKISITFDASMNATVTVSGRFYHFIHGYVDISTPTPLYIPWYSEVPISGVLRIVGASGTGAELDYGVSEIRLELDGDGLFDDGTISVIL